MRCFLRVDSNRIVEIVRAVCKLLNFSRLLYVLRHEEELFDSYSACPIDDCKRVWLMVGFIIWAILALEHRVLDVDGCVKQFVFLIVFSKAIHQRLCPIFR